MMNTSKASPGNGLRNSRKCFYCVSLAAALLLMFCQNGQATAGKVETTQANRYPIVLLHGFTGWGRDEMAGFKYWGGITDLQLVLRDKNYPVYTATVGPVSSNWDRACDFYAFVKGGRVDYGEAHSARHGHARFGRTYNGVLPLWGESEDAAKIHIVGHSLGSQTARMVTTLLNDGSSEERKASSDSLSPLFEGGHDWVFSVTTLSGDHDGSTVVVKQNPAFKHMISSSTTGDCSLKVERATKLFVNGSCPVRYGLNPISVCETAHPTGPRCLINGFWLSHMSTILAGPLKPPVTAEIAIVCAGILTPPCAVSPMT